MSFINYVAREINCKIVFYGAGLSGKTANLRWICDHAAGQTGGKLITRAPETSRTPCFDLLPIDVGSIGGFKTRFHLYAVPGKVLYGASRRLVLHGVDGVVFVADSQAERLDANLEAIDNLMENLDKQSADFETIPYVLQLNKRDLPGALPVETLKNELLRKNEPVFETIAHQGVGVFETLKSCGGMVLNGLKQG